MSGKRVSTAVRGRVSVAGRCTARWIHAGPDGVAPGSPVDKSDVRGPFRGYRQTGAQDVHRTAPEVHSDTPSPVEDTPATRRADTSPRGIELSLPLGVVSEKSGGTDSPTKDITVVSGRWFPLQVLWGRGRTTMKGEAP